jgi:hypothetical protein
MKDVQKLLLSQSAVRLPVPFIWSGYPSSLSVKERTRRNLLEQGFIECTLPADFSKVIEDFSPENTGQPGSLRSSPLETFLGLQSSHESLLNLFLC